MEFNENTYDNIKEMMESEDVESNKLAYAVIQNADIKDNMTFLLLLMKEVNVLSKIWLTEYNRLVQVFKEIGVINTIDLSYSQILEIIMSYQVPKEHFEFFMKKYIKSLEKNINNKYHIQLKLEINVN